MDRERPGLSLVSIILDDVYASVLTLSHKWTGISKRTNTSFTILQTKNKRKGVKTKHFIDSDKEREVTVHIGHALKLLNKTLSTGHPEFQRLIQNGHRMSSCIERLQVCQNILVLREVRLYEEFVLNTSLVAQAV